MYTPKVRVNFRIRFSHNSRQRFTHLNTFKFQWFLNIRNAEKQIISKIRMYNGSSNIVYLLPVSAANTNFNVVKELIFAIE